MERWKDGKKVREEDTYLLALSLDQLYSSMVVSGEVGNTTRRVPASYHLIMLGQGDKVALCG